MSSARSGAATVLVLLGAAAGCAPPRTVIDVALATDVPATRTLSVRATVLGGVAGAGDAGARELDFGPGQRLTLPGDFWLQPGAGADDASVTLVLAVAVGPGDHGEHAATFRRVATWRFVPGAVEHESIFLTLGCVVGASGCTRDDVQCTVAELCEEGGGTCGDDAACHTVQLPMPDAGSDAGDASLDAPTDVPARTDAAFDALPDAPVPADVPPDVRPDAGPQLGQPCDPMIPTCPAGSGCFMFTSPAGSRCQRCGQAGERACGAAPCASGTSAMDASGAPICYDAHRPPGFVGGPCTTMHMCVGGAQCLDLGVSHTSSVSVCLECGAVGEFCCCPGGTSCACSAALACATSSGPTICY